AGSLASGYGDTDNAIKYLQKARELSPKKQTLLFSLGSTYLGRGDFDSGVKIMKEAFELDKSFSEARIMYVTALLYAKNKTEALAVLKELPKEAALNDQRILQAFYTGGFYTEALESINFIIGKTPNNPAFYFSRAAIQYRLGKPNQAILDLNKVVELNPAVKGEIDGVINKIRTGQPI
ncbi:MAG: tetratricopeptide repeat protein, partial [Candidatus Taylorbacteria bacterium]|nr:tetratricopeptide repeat protein [Candidatus Taylorbacteria bacterium]